MPPNGFELLKVIFAVDDYVDCPAITFLVVPTYPDFSILEGSLHTLTPPTPTPVFTFGVNRPYWTKPVYGREVRFFFESNGFAYTDNLLDLFINENGVEHRRPITAATIRPAAASVTKFCCWLVGLQKRQVLSLLRWYFGC